MRIIRHIIRVLLGAIYLFNGALPWTHLIVLPMPNPRAGAILTALSDTDIVMQIVKMLEMLGGVLLLANRFVPLALLILFPLTVFISIVDLYLDPNPLAVGAGAFLFMANVALMLSCLKYYRTVLTYKITL
jgi:putative oxidoreductase